MGQKGGNMASLVRENDSSDEDYFRNWGVQKLKSYLTAKEVPVGNTNKQRLLNPAVFARKLGLKVVKNVEENQIVIDKVRVEKLRLEEGRINLPDPDTLKEGWEDNALSYPELSQMNVENYWDESKLINFNCSHTVYTDMPFV